MATTTNFGWTTPDDTDLVKDGAAAIRTLGSGIDTSLVDLKGGTTGQVLSKASNTDLDYSWTTPADQTPLTTKGDLFTFTTVDARLGVGADGTVLTSDSNEASGLKWATPAAGGKVLQVVQDDLTTELSVTSTTYTDTGLTVNITPSSASSKILVMAAIQGVFKNSGDSGSGVHLKVLRDATYVTGSALNGYTGTSIINQIGTVHFTYLDSPATTSQITYKVQIKSNISGQIARINYDDGVTTPKSAIVVMEIGA